MFVDKCWVCKNALGPGHVIPIRLAHADGGTEDLYRHTTCADYSAEDRTLFADRAGNNIQVGAGGYGRYRAPNSDPNLDAFHGIPETIS